MITHQLTAGLLLVIRVTRKSASECGSTRDTKINYRFRPPKTPCFGLFWGWGLSWPGRVEINNNNLESRLLLGFIRLYRHKVIVILTLYGVVLKVLQSSDYFLSSTAFFDGKKVNALLHILAKALPFQPHRFPSFHLQIVTACGNHEVSPLSCSLTLAPKYPPPLL